MSTPNLKDQLEALLDKTTISALLDDLNQICIEKAEHVRINWQDNQLADGWDEYADALSAAISKIMKMEVKP